MEKKTIGQFIAALRKANGMTQKELAEQLNVSDKAVSRWERDESAPDLSLIPVLAEIFNVTSDEILRGERINYQVNQTERNNEKGKKQLASLLNRSKTRFRVNSIISLGIAGVGLIGAMIVNLGFLRAYIGFFVGCIFYLGAIVCEFVFLLMALSAINMEEVESKDIAETRADILKWFIRTIIVIICLFAFTLPLILSVYDAYWGLGFESWLAEGFVAAGATLLIGMAVEMLLPKILKGTGTFQISEVQEKHNQIKLKYAKRTGIILLITFALQVTFNAVVEPSMLTQGTTFDNYADFKKFMETDSGINNGEFEVGQIFYDEYGNQLSEEEALTGYLYDGGEVVLEYIARNQSVAQMEYGNKDGLLPITVYTYSDLRSGNAAFEDINEMIVLAYIIEIAVGTILYFRKKKTL